MRFLVTLFATVASASALAGGMLGTKEGMTTAVSPPSQGGLGFFSFIQMIAALAVVMLLLKFVLPKLAGFMNKKITTPLGSVIKIEESAAFAGGTLYVVQAKSKTLLLSVAGTTVSCLADITDAPVTKPQMDALSFQEMIEQEIVTPTFAVAEVPAEPANEEIALTLERLSRFAS